MAQCRRNAMPYLYLNKKITQRKRNSASIWASFNGVSWFFISKTEWFFFKEQLMNPYEVTGDHNKIGDYSILENYYALVS